MKKPYSIGLFVILILATAFFYAFRKQGNSKGSLTMDKQTKATKNMEDSYIIKNKELTATILKKGAELAGLKNDSLEYIWQADPEYWPRHSPVLFPIVGRLKDHEYIYKGTTYPMKQHGFARDNDFRVLEKTDTSITFEQKATAASKKIYPFDFVLQIKYTLTERKLNVEYAVKNPADTDLYFSIGAHPAFSCPFGAGQKRNEYELVFDKKESPKVIDKIDGLYIDQWRSVFEKPGVLDLTDTIFDDDSLTFNPNPFSEATFVYKPTQKPYLKVIFKDFPYLGIWSAGTAPFVCIEPWHGVSDRLDHNKQYTEKEGVMKLPPHKTFHCQFTIEVL